MIADLKPYPAYKASRVPWMGEVPEHWEVRKLRNILIGVTDRNRPDMPLLSVVREKGVILRDVTKREENYNFIPDDLTNYKVVRKGQLAMNKMKAWQGSYGVSRHDGIVSPAYFIFDIKEVESPYFHWAIRSKTYIPFFTQASDGVRIGQWDLSQSRMKEIPFFIPPLPEQAAIVRFLDHMDRRIRRYTRAKQKLIKLLEEQKQTIIHRVVTRGLNPNLPLRASGIDWLGDLPEDWEVVRNGRLFIQRNETGFPELPILEVSLKTGVRIRNFENSERKQVMADRSKYKRAAKGDIAYNMMRMWQGAVGVTPVDGLVSPAYVVARPLEGIEPRYFSALFRTSAYMGEVDKYSRGIVKDRNRLYWEDFKQMPTVCPPYEEQVQIADTIEQRTATIDDGICRIEREMSLLREYRTRLIADVVTGKVDLREVAGRLPDEELETEPLEEAEALNEEATDNPDEAPEEEEA